jgi:hypothetical protein
MEAVNSKIDQGNLRVNQRKQNINTALMEPLICIHNDPEKFMDLLTYPPFPTHTYKELQKRNIYKFDELRGK